MPAYAGFEITFLPRASRGKKHFYPHKCASDTSLRSAYATRRCAYATRRLTPYAIVRAGRMFLSEKSQDFFDRLRQAFSLPVCVKGAQWSKSSCTAPLRCMPQTAAESARYLRRSFKRHQRGAQGIRQERRAVMERRPRAYGKGYCVFGGAGVRRVLPYSRVRGVFVLKLRLGG